MGKLTNIIFLAFLLVALYFVNAAFGLFEIPFFEGFDMIMHLIGAALILFAGFSYRKAHKY